MQDISVLVADFTIYYLGWKLGLFQDSIGLSSPLASSLGRTAPPVGEKWETLFLKAQMRNEFMDALD